MFPIMILSTLISAYSYSPSNVAAIFRFQQSADINTLIDALATELKQAGYSIIELDADGLCDPSMLTKEKIDLLVIPDSSSLPAKSVQTIENYLKSGGNIIALKAPMWQRELINLNGRWLTRDEYQTEKAGELPENMLFSFASDDILDWQRSSNHTENPTFHETIPDGPASGLRSLHVTISNLEGWDTYGPKQLQSPFPNGNTLTVFSAKGDINTTQLSVEWMENYGSRWIAVVPLTQQWKKYVLAPKDFKYWESVPARARDHFKPENVVKLSIGLAFSHTGYVGGKHEYWIGPFGTARLNPEYEQVMGEFSIPALDTLSPGYKFFRSNEVANMQYRSDQAIASFTQADIPKDVWSSHPRPKGGGFDKGRNWRWIPLLEANTDDGEWRGNPVTMLIHSDGQYKGGIWASFGIRDIKWYLTPNILNGIGQIASAMKRGVFIIDGGTNFYTYFEDQEIKFGAKIANLSNKAQSNLTVIVKLNNQATGEMVIDKKWDISLNPGEVKTVSDNWKPNVSPDTVFFVSAEIMDGDKVIDRVSHEAYIWKPKEKKSFITVQNGDFILEDKRWRPHGINYLPSSGVAIEDGAFFEYWLDSRPYDPEVIERDLRHIRDMGFNSVSIFAYHRSIKAQNLLDFLRRLEKHNLKANLSLRPGTPLNFLWDQMREIIEYYRLWEHDAVFALDLAWEPMWGNHDNRKEWDAEWEKWIIERYGSIENAEKDWQFAVPRDEQNKITNPFPQQIESDGDWRRMVAGYRRFLDTLLYKKYSNARRLVKSIDPYHLVSFRMTEAGDPTFRSGSQLPYDFPYLAGAVDILEPEAYGRIGDWNAVKPGWFEFEYARWAAPDMPMIWAEAGVSAWDISYKGTPSERLEFQANLYKNLYRMFISSGADGVFFWWYPGGFRYGENSDYGVINPDGSMRAVTKVIKENADKFINGASAKAVDYWIEIDRDSHPDGIAGVYDSVKDEFWKTIENGRTPGLKTAGTGTNSSNCPLIAVGNNNCDGTNPPKYLDAVFDSFQVQDSNGEWVSLNKGDRIKVRSDKPVIARVLITNLGEAEWIKEGDGCVYVVAEGKESIRTVLHTNVQHLDSIELNEVTIAPSGLDAITEVTITMLADGRTRFGERFSFILIP
jgi:hypothetical protein